MKILLAVGDKRIEDWFKIKVAKEGIDATFTSKVALYREMVPEILKLEKVDLLIIKEKLPVTKDNNGDILTFDGLISNVRVNYPSCRIIVIAGQHQEGDEFLRRLISRGIYDIVYGSRVSLPDVLSMIKHPRQYKDVVQLQNLDETQDDNNEDAKTVDIIYQNQEKINEISQNNNKELVETIVTHQKFAGIIFRKSSPCDYFATESMNTSVLSAPSKNQEQVRFALSTSKEARIIMVTAARQGVGCTSVAINVACNFASKGYKTLLIDGNVVSSIYEKLGIPYKNPSILQSLNNAFDINLTVLTHDQIIREEKQERYNFLPDKLDFLRLTDAGDSYPRNEEAIESVLSELKKYYDYIIIDGFMSDDLVSRVFHRLADLIILVTLQDIYEINYTNYTLSLFEQVIPVKGKLSVLINRFVRNLVPDRTTVESIFYTKNVNILFDDAKGHITATTNAIPYIFTCRRYYRKMYEKLCDII